MNFFQNTWVVGIITGIISGIAVSFFSKFFVKKKENIEYKKQIKSANLEVISALKPYIADNGLPEIRIFRALIFSVARKYSV